MGNPTVKQCKQGTPNASGKMCLVKKTALNDWAKQAMMRRLGNGTNRCADNNIVFTGYKLAPRDKKYIWRGYYCLSPQARRLAPKENNFVIRTKEIARGPQGNSIHQADFRRGMPKAQVKKAIAWYYARFKPASKCSLRRITLHPVYPSAGIYAYRDPVINIPFDRYFWTCHKPNLRRSLLFNFQKTRVSNKLPPYRGWVLPAYYASRATFPAPPAMTTMDRMIMENTNVIFEEAKALIDPSRYDDLSYMAKLLKKHVQYKLEIRGYACDIGPTQFNQKLSMKRAVAVRNFFIAQGIKANRLVLKAFGENRLHEFKDERMDRANSRRVEFGLIYVMPSFKKQTRP